MQMFYIMQLGKIDELFNNKMFNSNRNGNDRKLKLKKNLFYCIHNPKYLVKKQKSFKEYLRFYSYCTFTLKN